MSRMLHSLMTPSPVVTDGAWGTQLQAQGLPIGACPDAWNLHHPDRVEALARAYVEAGSQVVLTNTFGANRIALARHGLGGEVAAINRAGVATSRRASGTAARIFGSIGPTGVMLAAGDISEDEVRSAFSEQAQVLAEAGADALLIETMSDLTEAELAVAAARETGLPVVACMAFGVGKAGDRTMMGVTPEQAAEALAAAGADVLGANCGNGAAELLPVCRRLRAATDRPIWMKPNAGLPELTGGPSPSVTYRTTPEQFAQNAAALVEAGADFIGGCCGTGPAFIRAVVQELGRESQQ
jgi:5-methyltetrahydrofolate--homocysteine methyltransferase